MNTKRLTKLVALALVMVMSLALVTSCDLFWKPDPAGVGRHTYQTYTAISPSNWNELTYQDNNDTQIMGYLGSSFFSFDFAYDEDGEIIPGDFTVNYNAATKLEDVTAKYAEAWDLDPESTGYAYAITLREDLRWENGDPIKAEDFVYTMQEQLNPLFQNYRADSYYASAQSLVGAKSYAKQGQAGWVVASDNYTEYTEDLDENLIFTFAPSGATVAGTTVLAVNAIRAWLESQLPSTVGYTAAQMVNNVLLYNFASKMPSLTSEVAAEMEGKTLAEIKANPAHKAAWDELVGFWKSTPNEELDMVLAAGAFPEFAWENVGMFVGENEYEIVIILEKALDLLKEDGSLGYKAAYNMSSLPLVHKATYEACKKAPAEGSTLWTTTYHTSVETTMSWGAYKLTTFQAGKQYILERNNEWYGYGLEENEGLYQTDRILCETIGEWNTAWLKFQAGEIDGIGIDVSIADEYKGSSRAYYTPSDYVGSLQLQSDAEKLKERGETDEVNKMLLTYTDFRKALSLSIDRADYNKVCTTASLAGFGLFNSMHYYDVPNGGVFRNTDEAKKVLCNVYAVDYTQYPTLDDAVAAITGYNVEKARELVESAYAQALEDGVITENDPIKFTFGTSVINETMQRRYDYLVNTWTELFKGTSLEGRVSFEMKDFSTKWADDFRGGAYDICMGGWTGAAWDPGYFLLAYLSPDYMYSQAWDTSSVEMTYTMVGVGEDGGDITATMSLMDWYDCLNGNSGCKYNWASGVIAEDLRLQLIAALEQEILSVYYTVPIQYEFSASMLSHKVDYVTYEYNTFMGYGGLKYMTYNYDDAEWETLVHDAGGVLDYKN